MKIYCVQLNNKKCLIENKEDILNDVARHLQEMSENDFLKISILKITEEEYDKIPEFEGW
jgi:hypothetical protein